MAIEAGVYGLFGHPTTELLDPFELQRRRLSIQNALAAQQLQGQQIAGGALALDQQQRAIAQQEQTRNALRAYYLGGTPAAAPGADPGAPAPPAPALPAGPGPGSAAWDPAAAAPAIAAAPPAPAAAPPPGGAPPAAAAPAALSTEVPSIASLIKAGVDPIAAAGVQESFQKAAKETADIQAARDKSSEAMNNYGSHMAAALVKSGFNPGVLASQLEHFASMGPQQAQSAQQIRQLFATDPERGKAFLTSLAGSTKEARDAAAREQEVASTAGKNNEETLDMQIKRGGGLLGSTRDKLSYTTAYNSLPADVRKLYTAPEDWTPATAAEARQRGMTGAEQVTTAQTAASAAEAARHNKVDEGIRALEASLSRQRLDWEKTGGASLDNPVYMQGVVDGTIQINPRDKNFAETEARAKAIDKTWSADRFNNRKAYMQSVTSGQLGRELTSINQGLAHAGEYKAASDRVGVVGAITPGAAMVSGDVRAFLNARDTVGHEFTTMFNQGSGTQSETHQTQQNLNSWTQSARNQGVNEYAKLISGRVRALAKKHTSATGEPFPVDQFIDSSAVDFLKSQGVDVYKVAADESASWLKSHGGGGAPPAAGAAAPAAAAPVVTAIGPGGHRIGSHDNGQTWFDLQTGKPIQ